MFRHGSLPTQYLYSWVFSCAAVLQHCAATLQPTSSHEPTHEPTHKPTHEPTHKPTHEPTHEPTHDPTHEPTQEEG